MPNSVATDPFLTIPSDIDDYTAWLATGNEYLALPMISPIDGAIYSINLVHAGAVISRSSTSRRAL